MNFNKDKLNKAASSLGKKAKSLAYHTAKGFQTGGNSFIDESLLGTTNFSNKKDKKTYKAAHYAGTGLAWLFNPAGKAAAKILGTGAKAISKIPAVKHLGTKAKKAIRVDASKYIRIGSPQKKIVQKARFKNPSRKGQKILNTNKKYNTTIPGSPNKGKVIIQGQRKLVPGMPKKLTGQKVTLQPGSKGQKIRQGIAGVPGTPAKKGVGLYNQATTLGAKVLTKTPLNLLANVANKAGKTAAKYTKKAGDKLLYPKGKTAPNPYASLPQKQLKSTGNPLGKVLSSGVTGTTVNAATQGLTYGAGYAGAKFGADAARSVFDKNKEYNPSAASQQAFSNIKTSGVIGAGLGVAGGVGKFIGKAAGNAMSNKAISDFLGFIPTANNNTVNKSLDKISDITTKNLKPEDLKHFLKSRPGINKNSNISEVVKNSTGIDKITLTGKALANAFPNATNIQGIGNALEKNKIHMKKSFHIIDSVLNSNPNPIFKGVSKYITPLEKQQIATTVIKGNSVNVQTFKKIKNYGKSLATPGMDYKDVMGIINNNKLPPSLEVISPRALGQYNSLKKAVGELFKKTRPDGSTVILDTITFKQWRDFYLKSRNQYIEEGKTLLRNDLDNNMKKVYSALQDGYTRKAKLFLNPKEFNLNKLNKEYSENEKVLNFVNNFSENKGSLNFQERWLFSKIFGWFLTGAGAAAGSIAKGQGGSLKSLHDAAERLAGEASQPGKIWGRANIGYGRSNNEEDSLIGEMGDIQNTTNNPELEDFKEQKLEDSKKIRTETPSILDKFKQQKAEDMEMRL